MPYLVTIASMEPIDPWAYADEQLSQAVDNLDRHAGDLRTGIGEAYVHRLLHLRPENTPPAIHQDLADIENALNRFAHEQGDGTAVVNAQLLPDDEAKSVAEKIRRMAKYVSELRGP